MGRIISGVEFFGIAVVLILIYGSLFENKQKIEKNNAFVILCVTVGFALGFDALTWANIFKNQTLLTFLVTMSFVMPECVYSSFMYYLYKHFSYNHSNRSKVSTIPFTVGILYSGLSILLCLFLVFGGKLFWFEKGVYIQSNFYYNIYLISYIIIIIYIFFLIALNFKKVGVHDGIASLLFLVIPVIFIIINFLIKEAAFGVASLSLDLLIIYVMIQSEKEQVLLNKQEQTFIIAHHDELTGLLNRLAYSERCDQMKEDEVIGVLFADINGLKYTNDHFGHVSGDKLICDFADLLTNHFSDSEIYRISGDEFVVIIKDMDEHIFGRVSKMLGTRIREYDVPIACYGTAYGKGGQIDELIRSAEKKMYEEKERFYEKYKEYSRR